MLFPQEIESTNTKFGLWIKMMIRIEMLFGTQIKKKVND